MGGEVENLTLYPNKNINESFRTRTKSPLYTYLHIREYIFDVMPFIRPFPGEGIGARPSHTPKKTKLITSLSSEGPPNPAKELTSEADL